MKKVWIGILTVVTVLAVGTVSTFAAGPGQGRFAGSGICNGTGVCRYLDAEQDGVCVSCGADRPTASAGPERADLIRMKTATGSAIIPSAGPARDRAGRSAEDTAGNRGTWDAERARR